MQILSSSTPSTPNVLLVDDNSDGLLVRRCLLEEIGCCVATAVNGEEGLTLFQRRKFDVVVTDYRMPRMDGAELIRRIRLLDPNAQIILLSGFVEPLGLTEENTGADAVIAKSANEPARLVRMVRRLVNRAARKPPGAQTARSRISSAC